MNQYFKILFHVVGAVGAERRGSREIIRLMQARKSMNSIYLNGEQSKI